MEKFEIRVKKDHLSKVASGKPKSGLCELIWNAFDADATNVDVYFKEGEFGVDAVIISDDGDGIPHDKAKKLFINLGGSWKAAGKRTKKGRFLHGQEGKGRFKAFTIGRVVEWNVVYRENGSLYEYTITGVADTINEFLLSPKQESKSKKTGVTVEISEINRNFHIFDEDKALDELAPVFALYFRSYPAVSLRVNGKKLDASKEIKSNENILIPPLIIDGDEHSVSIEIIEWNGISEREIWFSDSNGFPLEPYDKQVRGVGESGFSAYIKSDYFRELHNKGLLSLRDLEASISACCNVAINTIKDYFLSKALEQARDKIDEWKDENIYPFQGDPITTVEDAERKVFDIVAVNINKNLPGFNESNNKSKKFQLRLLKQAIEKSPEDLQKIMTEVLNLPKSTRENLAELLQETSLSSIISASKVVTDRINFITGLEQLIFKYKKNLKERTQLHRILAKNTWIFGDAFTLSVDDQSLTEVLRKHVKFLDENIMINEPVKRLDKRRGIVDLMLSKQMPKNRANELEHLVVELKRPDVVIGQKEIEQIKSYAFAVAKDERFISLKTRWDFWIISNNYDDFAEMELENEAYADGIIYKTTKKYDITIWLKTWGEVIEDNKHRLEFIRDRLNYNIDKEQALDHLKQTYAEYVDGVFIDGSEAIVDEKKELIV